MTKIVDSKGAKKLDEDAQKLGISGMVLMERAALSTAEFIKNKFLISNKNKKVIAICGSGNNGGDGVACARILYEWGFNVEVLVVGKEEKFTKQIKSQVDLAVNSEVEVKIVEPSELITNDDDFEDVIIIDAIFGVGFKGRLEGDLERLAKYLNMVSAVKVAIDIPSGVNGSNGKVESIAIKCDYTVTFGVNKIGISVYPGKGYAGEVMVVDIGFPKKALEMVSCNTFTFDETDIGYFLPKREEYSNKGDFGKILIIAGSEEMCGASYLSALAAYRTGAGLVRIFTPEANRTSLQNLIPEAILTTYNDRSDMDIGAFTEEKLYKVVKEWADVIVIGPGLGISVRSKSIVKKVVDISEVTTIVDADGLRLFREVIEEKENRKLDLKKDLKTGFVLTPHIKELSDLLYLPKEEVKDNIIEISDELSYCKGMVVIKEARTVVTGEYRCYINNSGNSAMAKAGSGDVLTGIIAALMVGDKLRTFMMVALGVYIHGLAGDMLKERKGRHGILARELADEVAEVMKRYA
ncbi:MAG: NAD(P)H-hydrate dehydratase [Catonella sp.]|uniref:NAD(P)H-hydrate dehydratase n=1 Tax=Catonella sp. TaxID=2382125 RepID=UPI003FA15DC7